MHPKIEDEMTCVDTFARDWTSRLQRREIARSEVTKPVARRMVAREIGVSPGTLENIERGRTKGVRGWIVERIKAAVIRELEAEIRGAQHELEVVRQCGVDPRSTAFSAVAAAVEDAKQQLNSLR